MEKDWASGMCSVIRKAKSNRMTRGIPHVRVTTKLRWGDRVCCVWEIQVEVKTIHYFTPLCTFLQDDVSLMKELKLNHYRFSISWPRLIPTGIKCEYMMTKTLRLRLCWTECSSSLYTVIPFPADHVNEKGIQYYDELINHLLENNITPIVTLYHWDLPQVKDSTLMQHLLPRIAWVL